MKTKSKHIEEIGTEKEGEVMGEQVSENAMANALGSLDSGRKEYTEQEQKEEHRASISEAIKSENKVPAEESNDEIMTTKVMSIEDLAGKSDSKEKDEIDKLKKE